MAEAGGGGSSDTGGDAGKINVDQLSFEQLKALRSDLKDVRGAGFRVAVGLSRVAGSAPPVVAWLGRCSVQRVCVHCPQRVQGVWARCARWPRLISSTLLAEQQVDQLSSALQPLKMMQSRLTESISALEVRRGGGSGRGGKGSWRLRRLW